METVKKYWVYIVIAIVAIYMLFFNKKGKSARRRVTRRGRRMVRRGYSRARMRYRRMRNNRRR